MQHGVSPHGILIRIAVALLALAVIAAADPAEARTRSFCSGFVSRACGRHLQPQCTSGTPCDSGYHTYTGAPFPITIDCPFPFADSVVRGGCYETLPSCDDCGGEGQDQCPQETAQFCPPGCDPGYAVVAARLEPNTCHRLRTIGEGCSAINPCVDSLDCELCPLADCHAPLQCIPNANNGPITQEQCLRMHSDDLQQGAVTLDLATTYGGGVLSSAGNSLSVEVGAVYAPDGRFGCYITTCAGVESNADVASFGTVGFYDLYDHVAGSSIASVEAASIGPVGFSTAQIFSGPLIGTADYFSLGASVLPISVGVYQCDTTLDTVIGLPPLTPTPTPTSAPSATPTVAVCSGDCDASGRVTVDKLILGVNIALGQQLLDRCRSLDADGDGRVAINELIRAVGYALGGCPGT
jgi:hypothetical protein